jgi:hypothetical protein
MPLRLHLVGVIAIEFFAFYPRVVAEDFAGHVEHGGSPQAGDCGFGNVKNFGGGQVIHPFYLHAGAAFKAE